MAREKRVWDVGATYHVFSRGSNRGRIFLGPGDWFDFARVFAEELTKHEVDCFAWAFLPNHWHAVVRCPEGGLSSCVQRVNHRHALRFNRRRGRTAHCFENRFGAVIQDSDEQYAWTLRYVLRNPVVARIARTVEDARWTSYRATVGLVPAPPFLQVSDVLRRFGRSREQAIAAFREFLEGDDPVDESVQSWHDFDLTGIGV